MKITQLKICGIREPIGFAFPNVDVSFKVTDTPSKKAQNIRITLLDDFGATLLTMEGAELSMTGQKLDVSLRPRTGYTVKIWVFGDAGDCAEAETRFETGKMLEGWTAQWISGEGECNPLLEKVISVRPGLKKARLYASGVGLFEAFVNGEKLGDEYLKPGVTNYETRIQVITFPVEHLYPGENTLAFLLGKGWYMGTYGLENQEKNYGDQMAVIGELHLIYADGSEEVIPTDGSFRWKPSDITESGIYYGEDLNRTTAGQEWKPAVVIADNGNLQKAHLADRLSIPVRVQEKLEVQEVLHTPEGETVLDFGQNFAGFPEFDADFPSGTVITLDFGETLQNGSFYRDNYRDARSRFVYVSDGGKETVRPTFTFFGFRYVKVTGWPGAISGKEFRGCVLYSDLQRTGRIVTGNPKINRLYQNTLWSMKSNFIDMPTDCPQRSERLGWTGDAQIFAPTASYHMDTRAFFHKFQQDLMDEQVFLDGAIPNYVPNLGHKRDVASAWGDIGTFLPMTIWSTWGSRQELEFAYPMMRGWVDYMQRQDSEKKYIFDPGLQFGDWLALDGPTETSFKGSTDDRYLGAAYYYRSVQLTAQAASILGFQEDAEKYSDLAEKIREELLKEYFTPYGRFALDTQASYVVALKFGLWIDRERLVAQFQERLKKDNYRIRCGFIGAPLLCTVLAENGLTDLAYDFLLKEGFPSWLYCVNLGATTIWERWNSIGPDGRISDTGMNSLNHYSYGSVMEFLYAYGAGIRAAQPGWKKAVLAPNPEYRLKYLRGSFDSPAGKYVCNWNICDDGTVEIHAEIPFNCEAELILPRSLEKVQVLSAGSYDFRYLPTRDYRKPFDKNTPICKFSQCPEAMEILFRLVPPIGGMAMEENGENAQTTLTQFRYMSFLHLDNEKLEQAIREISSIILYEQ